MEHDTMIFSTLFDSKYIDKGLVLYDSLLSNVRNFKLYVVAFDDKCFQILSQYAGEHLIVISLKEFESPKFLQAKGNPHREGILLDMLLLYDQTCVRALSRKLLHGIDMDKEQSYAKRITLEDYFLTLTHNERNPFMFLFCLYRMLFQKSKDYIVLD